MSPFSRFCHCIAINAAGLLSVTVTLAATSIFSPTLLAQTLTPERSEGSLRVATFNVSLNRPSAGQLGRDLQAGDNQAKAIATIIRAIRPDVILLNEVDYDANNDNAQTLLDGYIAVEDTDLLGQSAWAMPYIYSSSVNTGVPSGLDLNGDGSRDSPEDAWGYGRFPGQYGMAVLSRFPIDRDAIRTFQRLRWSEMPRAMRPRDPESNQDYYDDETWQALRISSKSFWDVPIQTPEGTIHLLASHPTPPAFDGPEDRNGCRNHDEIKLIQHYIEDSDFLVDDQGVSGGLDEGSSFVILGDLNSDPFDGGSRQTAIRDLIGHERVAAITAPESQGAVEAALQQRGANEKHQSDPRFDTSDFSDRSVGNLRVDYALPSSDFSVAASGVFWPSIGEVTESQREVVQTLLKASDHRLVWLDLKRN